jgi:hypothetical protein
MRILSGVKNSTGDLSPALGLLMRMTMKKTTAAAIVALLIGCCAAGLGQPPACAPQLSVTTANVDQLSPADIDFQHFQSRGLLFTITIANACPSAATVSLEGTIEIDLADGSLSGTAGTFRTEAFTVPPPGLVKTNLDLGQGGTLKTSFSFSQHAKDRLQESALATGKFPDGRYIFHLALLDSNSQVITTTDAPPFVILNITRIELRSPADGETVNQFPLFEFYHEGSDVTLTVAEKGAGQSAEDAITRQPSMVDARVTGSQNSYLYAGGRQLEAGKTYVWRIVGTSHDAGGSDPGLSSPIWQFTVSSAQQSGAAMDDAILRQLEAVLGPGYKSLFDQIRSGEFRLTGAYSLNDKTLSSADLLNIINLLQGGAEDITVSFE